MSVSKTLYQLQKICSEHSDITFIKIDQHLEKLWKENKGSLLMLRNIVHIMHSTVVVL